MMLKFGLYLGLIFVAFRFCYSNKYSENPEGNPSCSGDHCHGGVGDSDDGPCMDDGKPRLYRYDPVKVGHVREVKVEDGKTVKMITRAIDPPIFEIPDFLSGSECDHILDVAREAGMYESDVYLDAITVGHKTSIRSTEGHSNSSAGHFLNWDRDRDYQITKKEIILFGETFKYLFLEDHEVEEMIEHLDLKALKDDGVIEYEEWHKFPSQAVDVYLNDLKEHHPHHKDRFSDQIWLFQGRRADKTMRKLRDRIWKLTKLPKDIVYSSEPLQVVGYQKRGHYNGHYDGTRRSDFPDSECCHFNLLAVPNCRLCRYITVLYYLNDVEEGGETAFPVADVPNFNETDFRVRRDGDRYNMNRYCHSAKVVVKPKKGKAIFWYNFLRDEKTGWMGERDDRSLHGGCDVRKGVKFIANNWIPTPEPDSADEVSNYLDPKDFPEIAKRLKSKRSKERLRKKSKKIEEQSKKIELEQSPKNEKISEKTKQQSSETEKKSKKTKEKSKKTEKKYKKTTKQSKKTKTQSKKTKEQPKKSSKKSKKTKTKSG